jgi:hypothetical protein
MGQDCLRYVSAPGYAVDRSRHPLEVSEEFLLMQAAIRLETTVLPGHRLEITAPELPEGARVEVIVVLPAQSTSSFGSALDFLESLPPGPRAFKTWEEYERHLQEERNAWER